MELDWVKAENWLKEIRQMYTDIGMSGLLGLQISINPLMVRFEKGERTQDLYDSIMSLE